MLPSALQIPILSILYEALSLRQKKIDCHRGNQSLLNTKSKYYEKHDAKLHTLSQSTKQIAVKLLRCNHSLTERACMIGSEVKRPI